MSMTGKIERVEVITSVQRRRRWSADEKAAVDLRAGHVGLAGARRLGIAPNQLFRWRRLYVEGALSEPSADIVRSKKTRPAPTRGKSRIGRGWGRNCGALSETAAVFRSGLLVRNCEPAQRPRAIFRDAQRLKVTAVNAAFLKWSTFSFPSVACRSASVTARTKKATKPFEREAMKY